MRTIHNFVGKTTGLADFIDRWPRALRVNEIAAILSISERQVYKLSKERRIPSFRIGGSIRFDPSVIANWLRQKSSQPFVELSGDIRRRA